VVGSAVISHVALSEKLSQEEKEFYTDEFWKNVSLNVRQTNH
jgi:hypothetical protein